MGFWRLKRGSVVIARPYILPTDRCCKRNDEAVCFDAHSFPTCHFFRREMRADHHFVFPVSFLSFVFLSKQILHLGVRVTGYI